MSQGTLKAGVGGDNETRQGLKVAFQEPVPRWAFSHTCHHLHRAQEPYIPGHTQTSKAWAAGQGLALGTWEDGAGPPGPLERHPGGGLGPELVAVSLFTLRLCCVTHVHNYHVRADPLTGGKRRRLH